MTGKPWFRHKSIGYGFTPASWMGWVATFVFLLAVLVTMALLGDPPAERGRVAAWAAECRARLGLSGLHLPYLARIVLVATEVAAFWAFCRSRAAPDPPFD